MSFAKAGLFFWSVAGREPLLAGEAGGASANDVRGDHDEQLGVGFLLVLVAEKVAERGNLAEAGRTRHGTLITGCEVSNDNCRLTFIQTHRAGELPVGNNGHPVEVLSGEGADLEIDVEGDAGQVMKWLGDRVIG